MIAGKANLGEQEFEISIKEIQKLTKNSNNFSFENCIKITFEYLDEICKNDNYETENEFFFCGFDSSNSSYRMLSFRKVPVPVVLDNGLPKMDDEGKTTNVPQLMKIEIREKLRTGGWTKCIHQLGEFNNQNISITLIQGFKLLNRIMNLAVTIDDS